MSDSAPEQPRTIPPQKRVTRTIVLEGNAAWVDATLEKSWVPTASSLQKTAFGMVYCTDRKDETQ